MLNTSVFEFPAIPAEVLSCEPFAPEATGELPDVPALPETLIALELHLGEWPVQLGEVADAVLGDLGATIQVLRLAGREYSSSEYGSSDYRPERIEDCICDLSPNACLAEAARGSLRRGKRHQEMVEIWAHAREIAQWCRLLAEDASGSMKPHEAYLVGLLHEMGSLPSLFGWERRDLSSNPETCAVRMAERWNFPSYLKDFFRELQRPGRYSPWRKLIEDAHRLAVGTDSSRPLVSIPMRLPA